MSNAVGFGTSTPPTPPAPPGSLPPPPSFRPPTKRKGRGPKIGLIIAAVVVVIIIASVLTSLGASPKAPIRAKAPTSPAAVITQAPVTQAPVTQLPPPPPSENAQVGDAITLAGQDDGEQVEVTVVKVLDPAKPYGTLGIPADAGNRYVAIQVRIHNVGTVVYDDAPTNSGKVVDADDQDFGGTVAQAGGPGFANGSVRIAPQDSRVGFLTFEVPKGAKVVKFQFTPDSGFGQETGEWLLQ